MTAPQRLISSSSHHPYPLREDETPYHTYSADQIKSHTENNLLKKKQTLP